MLPPSIGTCDHGHVNIPLVPFLCQLRSSCLTFSTELEFNVCAADAAIFISLLHLHSQLKVLHFCTTKHVLSIWNENQLMSLFYSYIAGSLHVSGLQAHLQESSYSCSHNHWFSVCTALVACSVCCGLSW